MLDGVKVFQPCQTLACLLRPKSSVVVDGAIVPERKGKERKGKKRKETERRKQEEDMGVVVVVRKMIRKHEERGVTEIQPVEWMRTV